MYVCVDWCGVCCLCVSCVDVYVCVGLLGVCGVVGCWLLDEFCKQFGFFGKYVGGYVVCGVGVQ